MGLSWKRILTEWGDLAMNLIILIPVILYMIVILGIGVYSSKKIQSTTDYLVAGRRLSPLVLAATLSATVIDGGSTLGIVGNSYGKWGVSAIWYIIAMGIALILMGIVAPKLRSTGADTVPEYFRLRYGKTAGLFHSILTIVSMVGLVAAQLKASATVVEVMTGLDYNTSLLIVAAVITIYSMLGGLWGVALTDILQLLLIVIGMTAAIPCALHMSGGWRVIQGSLAENTLNLTGGIGGWTEILGYILLFLTAFTVGEEVASGFFAASNNKAARKGAWIAGVIVIAFSAIPVILGVIMQSMYNNNLLNYGVVQALDMDAKYALPALAVKSMPSVIVGVLFAGILAATMSSADSSLLGAGSVYSHDIYHVFVNPEASQEKVVGVARVTMVFVMTLSFFAAIYGGNILTILAFSFGIRAAGTFVPYLMGHLWKKGNAWSCNIAILAGTLVFLWAYAFGHGASHAWPIFPGLVVSGIVYLILSLCMKNKI